MITVEEKLNTFSKMIMEKVEKERDKNLEEISKKNNEILERNKEILAKKREEIVKRKVREANIKGNEIISRANIDMKNRILHKKKEFMDILLADIRNKVLSFVEDDRYKDYILRLVDKIIKSFNKDIIIYLNNKDYLKFGDDIKKEIGNKNLSSAVTIKPTVEDIVGGAIGVSVDGKTRVDLTLDTTINDSKDYIGQVLYTVLEKGDIDG